MGSNKNVKYEKKLRVPLTWYIFWKPFVYNKNKIYTKNGIGWHDQAICSHHLHAKITFNVARIQLRWLLLYATGIGIVDLSMEKQPFSHWVITAIVYDLF